MIGAFAHWLMRSTWARYLMVGLALLAGVGTWSKVKERRGRSLERADAAKRNLLKLRRMIDAGSKVDTDRAGIVARLRASKF